MILFRGALAMKALVIYDRALEHGLRCPKCRVAPCEQAVRDAEEFQRLKKAAMMTEAEVTGLPAPARDALYMEVGLAMIGQEKVQGRRRRIVGWPKGR